MLQRACALAPKPMPDALRPHMRRVCAALGRTPDATIPQIEKALAALLQLRFAPAAVLTQFVTRLAELCSEARAVSSELRAAAAATQHMYTLVEPFGLLPAIELAHGVASTELQPPRQNGELYDGPGAAARAQQPAHMRHAPFMSAAALGAQAPDSGTPASTHALKMDGHMSSKDAHALAERCRQVRSIKPFTGCALQCTCSCNAWLRCGNAYGSDVSGNMLFNATTPDCSCRSVAACCVRLCRSSTGRMSQRSCWAPARAGTSQQKKRLELQSRCAHCRVTQWLVLRSRRLSKSYGLRKRYNSDSTSLRLMLLPSQQDAGVRITASWRLAAVSASRLALATFTWRPRAPHRLLQYHLLYSASEAWPRGPFVSVYRQCQSFEQVRPASGRCRSSPGRWAWRRSRRHNTHLSLTRCATMKRYSCPRGASKPPPMMWRAFYGAARALASGTRPFLGA